MILDDLTIIAKEPNRSIFWFRDTGGYQARDPNNKRLRYVEGDKIESDGWISHYCQLKLKEDWEMRIK